MPVVLAVAVASACDDGDEEPRAEAPTPTAVATAPPGPATFEVLAGAADGPYDIEQFLPATVRIRQGDSLRWRGQGHEGHTVTFIPPGMTLDEAGLTPYLAPAPDRSDAIEFNPRLAVASEAQGSVDGSAYVNSGFFGVPTEGEYTLAFPQPGVFPYLCMVHPLNMRGVVVVDEPDAGVPAPEAVAAEGERLRDRYLEDARRAASAVDEERRATATEAAAGRVWQVSAGIDTPQGQVLSFLPNDLQIEAGDQVVFWNSDRDFHNVIFAPEGRDVPQFPIIIPVEGRAGFRLLINPDAANEVRPPPGFGPDAYFSSGIMGILFPRIYYEVTFTRPGTYRFVCTVHTLAGMSGVINVR